MPLLHLGSHRLGLLENGSLLLVSHDAQLLLRLPDAQALEQLLVALNVLQPTTTTTRRS